MLTSRTNWEVCGEASDGREAMQLVEKLKPGLVILDITMPGLNGIDAARQIRKMMPDVKILIYSMHYAERLVQEVFQAGADGYVLKTDAGKHLIQAIESIMAGQKFFSSKVSEVISRASCAAAAEHRESNPRRSGSARASGRRCSFSPREKATRRSPGFSASAPRRRRRIAPRSCASSDSRHSANSSVTPCATASSSRSGYAASSRTSARSSKRVYSLRNVSGTSPMGPLRCLAIMSSASPATSFFASSSSS